MPYQAQDFMDLRSRIIKNSVLSNLLIACLTNQPNPIPVGTAFFTFKNSLRWEIKKRENKKKTAAMCNVVASIGLSFSIGYSYLGYDPVWTNHLKKPNKSYIGCLKDLTNKICEAYSLNATHADKIIGRLPDSLITLLEANKISANLWKVGFPRKFKKDTGPINESELQDYYNKLTARLEDWRNFNNILIQLFKEQHFELDNPKVGRLEVDKSVLNQRYLFKFTSYVDNAHTSQVVHTRDINPVSWRNELDIFTLRQLFSVT